MMHVTAPLLTHGPAGFARGTMILTPWGRRPVETLVPGDLIWTEAGAEPLRWTGTKTICGLRQPKAAANRPIRIGTSAPFVREGYMPLVVGPGQRIVLAGGEITLNLGAQRIATAATNLRHLPSVSEELGEPTIDYVSLHLNARAVIDANGFWTEARGPASIPADVTAADQGIFEDPAATAPLAI